MLYQCYISFCTTVPTQAPTTHCTSTTYTVSPILYIYTFRFTALIYDFKYSNGTADISDDGQDIYRGMPIGVTGNKQTIFTSARDVGNIAAGYIAGINGMSWNASRIAFDAYQSKSSGKPTIEGISTRNAEFYGWRMGSNIKNYTPDQKATILMKSIGDGLTSLWNRLYNGVKSIF